MSCRRIFWLLPSVLLLGGCASVAAFKGLSLDDESVYISGLPPFTQSRQYSCGATCVAAVAASLNVPPAEFRSKHPAFPQDMTGRDMTLLAEELGLRAFAYRGSLDDLEQNLRKGRPLIVMIPQSLIPRGGIATAALLNAWNKVGPKPAHWVVVIGFTKDKTVIIHDPASGPMIIKREDFQSWWAQKDCFTVLITGRG